MRGVWGVFVFVVFAAALTGSGSARRALDDVRTLAPVADAYVSEAAVSDTRRAPVLVLSAAPRSAGYITFAQPVPRASILSAHLELHVRRGGSGLTVALARRAWRGARLGSQSTPTSVKPETRLQRRLRSGSRVSIDVTRLVRGPALVTFVLRTRAGRLELSSAETGSRTAPRLIVVGRTAAEELAPMPTAPTPVPPTTPSAEPSLTTAGTPTPTATPTLTPTPAPAAGDTTPPSTPSGLQIAARDETSLTLAWNASTDDVGVSDYRAALAGGSSASTAELSHLFTGLACGTSYDMTVLAQDTAGNRSLPATLTAPTSPCPTLAVAGDIASNGNGDEITAALLDELDPTVILTTGDNAYPNGTLGDFTSFYEPTWGRHKARTRPTPGNHEYFDPGAAGYFAYFGDAAGDPSRGYYSFDLGTWHLIALNSEISHEAGSAQEMWLREDLAATSMTCVLAYWHKPRFTAGRYNDFTSYTSFWQTLYDADAELVLNGHDHNYQRYLPLDPTGAVDEARGMREFVIGTGGRSHRALAPDVRRATAVSGTNGVLELTLRAAGYSWRFVAEPGSSFTDAGSGACRE